MTGSSLHVVAGLGQSQGGPTYSVPRLCDGLRRHGAETVTWSVDVKSDPPPGNIKAKFAGHDFAKWPILSGLRISFGLQEILRDQSSQFDIIHSHGLWLMPNVYAGSFARTSKRPLVVSPRGMLAPEALAFSRSRKELFWKVLQGPAYREAAVWHATSLKEAEDIRRFGISAPIAVIPNGVDLHHFANDVPNEKPRPAHKTLLFLSRIHPKKGLENLVQAWTRLELEFPDWRLRIIGPNEAGHAEQLQELSNSLKHRRLSIERPVFAAQKWRILEQADLFVLPTRSENFGIAVAEALAAGVPAIVTRGAPWECLVSENCGWWIDYGEEPLTSALTAAMRLSPEARSEMGRRGKAFVKTSFDWDTISKDMLDVYAWVSKGSGRPDCIVD